jgi:hypothetical protein
MQYTVSITDPVRSTTPYQVQTSLYQFKPCHLVKTAVTSQFKFNIPRSKLWENCPIHDTPTEECYRQWVSPFTGPDPKLDGFRGRRLPRPRPAFQQISNPGEALFKVACLNMSGKITEALHYPWFIIIFLNMAISRYPVFPHVCLKYPRQLRIQCQNGDATVWF